MNKGWKHTPETKKYLGDLLTEVGKNTRFKKGQISPNKGKHLKSPMEGKKHTDATREKMRQARLKNPNRYWLGKKQPHHQGENNVNWRGGVTSEHEKIRKSVEYKEWRKSVFERDKYTCQVCSVRSEKGKRVYLEADHIKPFALYPDLRFEISNGRTLCKECHYKHGWSLFKNANPRKNIYYQGILENGLNSVEVSQEITPSQQER